MAAGRRVRLRDIADLAGVTPSTVSRVLNHAPEAARIPQPTRDRVERIAAELHYVPDQSARGLRTGRGFLVPLVLPDLTGQMVGTLYRALVGGLAPAGLNVIMGEADHLGDAALRDLNVASLAGLVVVGDIMIGIDLPTVRVAPAPNRLADRTGPVVRIDNEGGARQAAEYLLGLGHRRLAMISFGGVADVAERAVFAIAVTGNGAEMIMVGAGSLAVDSGRTAMAEVMSRPDPPTAVFAATDTLATGAILWCLEQGIAVPDRVSVMGFDDVGIGAALRPALTTIRQPVDGLGSAAATALLELVNHSGAGRPPGSQLITLPTELVVRSSTAAPPA